MNIVLKFWPVICKNKKFINFFIKTGFSSIARRVLSRELRGECGAGGYSGARGHDVTRRRDHDAVIFI